MLGGFLERLCVPGRRYSSCLPKIGPMLSAEGAPSDLPEAPERSNAAANAPLPLPLIVTHGARCFAPHRLDCGLRPGLVQAEHGLHPIPQRRGNPCGCPRRGCPVIPGLGAHKGRPYGCVQDDNSDQARRHRRGRKRWQEQGAGGTPALPGDDSPLEGESQKPSRQAKADAVGGGSRAARCRRGGCFLAPGRDDNLLGDAWARC